MSHVATIADEIPKNAFVLAREILAELGRENLQHFSGYWELRSQIAAPRGVSAVTHEYDAALTLVAVSLRAALDDKVGRVNVRRENEGKAIRLTIENQKEAIALPLNTAAAKLGEIERLLSDARNWVTDENQNFRHRAVFDKFRKYGLATQHFSWSILNDFGTELYDPKYGVSANNLKALTTTPLHSSAPVGLCLNYPQLERLSAVVGFSSPVQER